MAREVTHASGDLSEFILGQKITGWVPLKKHRCLPKPDLSSNTHALIPSLVIGFSWLKPTSGWEDNMVGRVLVSKVGWEHEFDSQKPHKNTRHSQWW